MFSKCTGWEKFKPGTPNKRRIKNPVKHLRRSVLPLQVSQETCHENELLTKPEYSTVMRWFKVINKDTTLECWIFF